MLASESNYEFQQGETVLFRVASASVEPTINLTIPGMSVVIIAYDGLPLPAPQEAETVAVIPGGRVEFLARFDTPGTYNMTRFAWGNEFAPNLEACTQNFGIDVYPCISYDIDKPVATITVVASNESTAVQSQESLISSIQLPGYSDTLKSKAERETVATKQLIFEMQDKYPLFQIPYDGPFVPPGVGFGINGRLFNPQYIAGNVTAGTCETWEIMTSPPGSAHPFHSHSARFLVTHEDGVEVDTPFWRDTYDVRYNLTIKMCFDAVSPGETFFVHCHAASHHDIGMATKFEVLSP
jgi:FtsP/CotA-like multicopper oxidase with cupredoxin domain